MLYSGCAPKPKIVGLEVLIQAHESAKVPNLHAGHWAHAHPSMSEPMHLCSVWARTTMFLAHIPLAPTVYWARAW